MLGGWTEMVTEVCIGDLFGKILKNWSLYGHLLGSKSPYPSEFLGFSKKMASKLDIL